MLLIFKDLESYLLMSSLVRRHDYHFLSLRLARNPSGFSERFPTSGNDINVALLTGVLVTQHDNNHTIQIVRQSAYCETFYSTILQNRQILFYFRGVYL